MKSYVLVSVVYTYEVRSQRKIYLEANEIMLHVIRDLYNVVVRILVKSNLCTFLIYVRFFLSSGDVYVLSTFSTVSTLLLTILITIVTFQQ